MQAAPPLKVSKQVTNVHSATKHSNTQHQKQTAEAAKNSSAPHARGGSRTRGYRKRIKKQRGAGSTVPTLSSTSGPPKSSPSAQGNINDSHKTNAAIVSAATNDSKVQAPKCKDGQSGGGSAVKVGQFMESLHNMDNKIGGSKKRRRKKTKRRRKKTKRRRKKTKRRRKKTKRRRKRRGTRRRRRRRRRRKTNRKLRRYHKRRTMRARRKNRRIKRR